MNDMFVRRRGEVSGPFSVDEIKAMIARGELMPLHELSHDGIEWTRAGKIWEEFVPKPKSMFEMAERRPVIVKPAVQPVDIHKGHGRKAPDHTSADHKPADHRSPDRKPPENKPKPERRESPPPAPRAVAVHAPSAESHADEASHSHSAVDDASDVADDDFFERDRAERPEPAVGAKALRGLATIVASAAVAWMGLSILCIVLDLRTLDAFSPPTLDRLSQIYASGMFAVSDFVRVLIFVFKAFFIVLFLTWVYFSARFLYRKAHGRMQFTPAWCVGWFLVPIMNLWKPYKVVCEFERRSEQFLRFDDPRVIRDPVVGVWWTCWVLEMFAFWFLISNRSFLTQLLDTGETGTPEHLEKLKQIPKLVNDFHTNEIACLCVAFVSGIATLVLLYRFERVRPKWETRSRRRRSPA